jgi:peptidoglycan/xylan/chitin deacetylase (PgdA/CDA1 family)
LQPRGPQAIEGDDIVPDVNSIVNSGKPGRRRPIATAASAMALVLAVTACATGARSPGSSPTDRAPEPVATGLASPTIAQPTLIPSPTPTPSPSPTPFHVVSASSCTTATVPEASPVPVTTHNPRSTLQLYVPILMYHRIIPAAHAGNSLGNLVVPPDRFDAQLAAIKEAGWSTITLARLAEDIEAGIRPPKRTFVITIDDGYADGYTYGLPILQKHGFVATYFVIAGRIGASGFLTADQIRGLVAAGQDIGNHTLNHARLSDASAARMRDQIYSGAATIAAVTGRWPETLAYPSGKFDNGTLAVVGACGAIKMAVSVEFGHYESWSTRFTVPRIKVKAHYTPSTILAWMG